MLPSCVSLGQASKPPSKPKKKMVYFVKLSKVVLDKDNVKVVVRCCYYPLTVSVLVLQQTSHESYTSRMSCSLQAYISMPLHSFHAVTEYESIVAMTRSCSLSFTLFFGWPRCFMVT